MKLTLSGEVTSSILTNAFPGQPLFLIICQDAGGGHAFVAPVNLKWRTATIMDPNYCSAQGFVFDGTTAYNFSTPGLVVRGSISGLVGNGLTLQLNGGIRLMVAAGATSFLFPNLLSPGQSYSVIVANQPASQSCMINNGSGTVSDGDVSNISISCSSGRGFTVGGTVQGGSSQFPGATVPITLTSVSGTETLNVSVGQAQFVFTTLLQNGASYSVSAPAETFQPPPGVIGVLNCSAINVNGAIVGTNVSDIVLTCVSSL